MSTNAPVLVTSAAGKTGRHVAGQLLEMGFAVRAFVRRKDHRSEALARLGAEIFLGNQYSISDLRAAMQGVRRAYHCAPTAPNGLHFSAAFAAAADEARLEHIVTLGQWLTSADHPSLFTREVYIGEALLRSLSGTTVTTVNPGWFADNYLMVAEMAAHLGVFAMPLGDGAVKKNAPPSNEDIASVVVGALADPESHAGQTYRPTGPALLSPDEIAAAMGRALARTVRYRDISERMMLKALKALPPANFSEAAASQLAIYAEEYRRGTFAVNAPTDVVETVGGRAAEPFESILRRTFAARPDLSASITRSLGALAGFAKVGLTRSPGLARIAADRDFVQLRAPRFSQDDADWRRSHLTTDPEPQNAKVA